MNIIVLNKAWMLITQISLKYAFKNLKICKYMPSNISNIPIFQQKYIKKYTQKKGLLLIQNKL
jgi:hypothetical protein